MSDQERLVDLLVARATEGLSEEETLEVKRALDGSSGVRPEDLELAAAGADLAFEAAATDREPMPEIVRQRVLERWRHGSSAR